MKKAALKDEIMKIVVNKGEVKSPSSNFELHDIFANIDQSSKVLTTYGG